VTILTMASKVLLCNGIMLMLDPRRMLNLTQKLLLSHENVALPSKHLTSLTNS